MKNSILLFMIVMGISRVVHSQDSNKIIEQEVGLVPRQLLEYSWQEAHQVRAPIAILEEATRSATIALQRDFAPPSDVHILVHHRGTNTCDAIQIGYRLKGHNISIIQTRLSMLILIEGPDTQVSSSDRAEAAANSARRNVLAQHDAIYLRKQKTISNFCLGQPELLTSTPELRERLKELGGFRLLKWWSDGKRIAFFGPKIPPKNQAALISTDVQANMRWFD